MYFFTSPDTSHIHDKKWISSVYWYSQNINTLIIIIIWSKKNLIKLKINTSFLSHAILNVSLKIASFLSHAILNVSLKMATMQKVNIFSDPSTTYKIIVKQLFIRALCSYFNHFNFQNFPIVSLIIRTCDYRSLDSFSCPWITVLGHQL